MNATTTHTKTGVRVIYDGPAHTDTPGWYARYDEIDEGGEVCNKSCDLWLDATDRDDHDAAVTEASRRLRVPAEEIAVFRGEIADGTPG